MLLDDTSNRGSDADSYKSQNAGQKIDPDPGLYDSANTNQIPSPFEDSGFRLQNPEGLDDEEFQEYQKQQRKLSLIDEAKRNINRGRAYMERTIPKKFGEAIGDKHIFKEDTEENRERAKELAKEKVQEKVREQINNRVKNDAFKRGFDGGFGKNANTLVKEGFGKVKEAAKATRAARDAKLAATAAKGAKTAATTAKAAKTGATAVKGVQGVVAAVGAASGPETLGLGFVASILLNIAISLGISDAIDAGFKLKAGDYKEARFLAIRACAKVGMFIYLLLVGICLFTIAGAIPAALGLVLLNIYMILGKIFPKFGPLQGLVWWEIAIIVVLDVLTFLIVMAFILAIGWHLCNETGLGGSMPGSLQGAAVNAIVTVYDWWNETTIGSVAADFCKYVETAGSTTGQ